MKHLFDRLAGLRPPSELGWVGTVFAVFVIVSVVMILVYLAMAVAKADMAAEPKERPCRTFGPADPESGCPTTTICGYGIDRVREFEISYSPPVCDMGART